MAILLAQSKNIHKVKGLDLSKEMIAIGNEKIAKKTSVARHPSKLVMAWIFLLKIPAQIYLLSLLESGTSATLKGLREMHRVLRDSCRCIIMEFSKNKFIKSFYLFYFRHVLPFVGNIISRDKMAYTYLNQTVEQFPYGNDFAKK